MADLDECYCESCVSLETLNEKLTKMRLDCQIWIRPCLQSTEFRLENGLMAVNNKHPDK